MEQENGVRLDHCLTNLDWTLRFKEATLIHQGCLKLNHRPLFLCLEIPSHRNLHRLPFRFEAAWVMHAAFRNFVRSHCRKDNGVDLWSGTMTEFTKDVKCWNQEVFGCIWKRKASLKRKLARLDARSKGRFDARAASKYNTWRGYEQVLVKEELHWFQKSRAKWLYLGDRHTKYFYGITIIRRRKNKYEMLKDENDLL